MDGTDGMNEFLNAKGELSMALEQLTAISENFFLAVELPQESLLAVKTVKLHKAVETVDNLVNILSDVIGDGEDFESIEDNGEQELVSSIKRNLVKKENTGKVSKKLKREKTGVSEMPNSTGGYSCQTCDKTFTQRRNLIVHIKTLHEGIRIPCPMCGHTASTKSNLKIHMKTKHNIEKDDSFNYGAIVEDHDENMDEFVIDGDIEEFSICAEEGVECILEEYDTEIQDTVEDDTNVVKDLVEDTDHVKENQSFEVSNTAEGYICPKCNKSFTQRRNLQEHIKTVHEGIRIPCTMCEHTASTKSNLRKHMKKKHNVSQ